MKKAAVFLVVLAIITAISATAVFADEQSQGIVVSPEGYLSSSTWDEYIPEYNDSTPDIPYDGGPIDGGSTTDSGVSATSDGGFVQTGGSPFGAIAAACLALISGAVVIFASETRRKGALNSRKTDDKR